MIYLVISTLLMISPFTESEIEKESEQEIRTLLEERDQQIKDLLGPRGSEYTQEQRDELRDIINDIIDFGSMASYALGATWAEIDQDLQEEFVSLFATIVRDHSLNRLDIYRAEVTYEEILVENSKAEVKTTAQLDNVRTPVGYTMEKQDSEWMIVDMIVDGVSTRESYHRQFQSIIRQRGFDALLDNLRRRAGQTRSG